jgi:hypothetical protein
MDIEVNGTDAKFVEIDGKAFVTYKGHLEYEAGYFYCPYIPLSLYNPMTGEGILKSPGFKTKREAVRTRYISQREEARERGWCLKLFDERYIC